MPDDLPGELRAMAAVLKTGAAGQRDAWVPQLEKAADEIERLRALLKDGAPVGSSGTLKSTPDGYVVEYPVLRQPLGSIP